MVLGHGYTLEYYIKNGDEVAIRSTPLFHIWPFQLNIPQFASFELRMQMVFNETRPKQCGPYEHCVYSSGDPQGAICKGRYNLFLT